MARSSVQKTTGPARIRFVVIDAEIPDGDVGSVTQVIQNALRTQTTIVHRGIAVNDSPKTIAHQVEDDVAVEDDEEITDTEMPAQRASRPRGPRKPSPTPDVVTIDMNADKSFASFAQGKDSKSQHKKYLIAAAWLKEHRNIGSVTAGHIYTCFRSIQWSTNIPDFWQPLRDLKAKKNFTKNEDGGYEINHLGLDYVQRLGSSNGAD